jgi:endonuclease/exonuclease/phosphatase family metal-dependent hydrolase
MIPALAAGVVMATIGPAVASPATADLVFASYNVCKSNAGAPAPPWEVRRDRVARVIAESGADVIGLQEATWQPTAFAKTQLLDIQNLTAPAGYVAPTFSQGSNECAWTAANPHKCTHTSALLFRSATVAQVTTPNGTPSAGVTFEGAIAGGLDADSASREVAWAYLRGLDGAGPFLALSIHTTTFKDAVHEASRVAFANALTGWVQSFNDAHGMAGVPVVLMADLNSYEMRQPQGAQKVLTTSGWHDAATAPSRRNTNYSSINYNPLRGDTGFPVAPYRFNRDATRIDYVLALGNVVPLDYEVVLRLTPDGQFDPAYQGSDHQMIRAVLGFPAA